MQNVPRLICPYLSRLPFLIEGGSAMNLRIGLGLGFRLQDLENLIPKTVKH